MNLKQVLAKVAKDQVPLFTKAGKIASVDTDNLTCEVTFDHYPTLYDVRLRSTIDGNEKGLIVIPKQGSDVIVGTIENTPHSAFIIQYSEVDEIRLGDNQLGGIVKAKELKIQIDKNTDALNQLIQTLKDWTPVSQDGGAALKAAISTAFPTINLADLSNIENTNVLH